MSRRCTFKYSNQKIKYLIKRYGLTYIESKELAYVINICLHQNFRFSNDLSNFIFRNNLGFYFPNICGILYMNDGYHSWKFYAGFSQNIYRILCLELNLLNKRSGASVTRFVPFKYFT